MSERRQSPGVPLPTLWQLLLMASLAGAGLIIWSLWDGNVRGSRVPQTRDAEQSAALDHLHTVEMIAQYDPDGLSRLVAELENSNPRMRRNALMALRRFGNDAQSALDPIRKRFADPDGQVRVLAIGTYSQLHHDPAEVAAAASTLLGDADPNVRETTAKVLESIGQPAVEPVTDLLRSNDSEAWIPALQILRRIGWDESSTETEPVVRGFVSDLNAAVRREALVTLVVRGHPNADEIRELLQVPPMHDSQPGNPYRDPGPHEVALIAIVRLGPSAAENLPDLVALLASDHSQSPSWSHVLVAVRSLKSAALPEATELFQICEQSRGMRRIDLAWTLLEIGAEKAEIAQHMIPALADADNDVRFHAGRICALADPELARSQVADLIPMLAADSPAERYAAVTAIWGLAPQGQEAIPALLQLVESADRNVARAAVMALGDMSPAAAPALPKLLALLGVRTSNDDFWVRNAIFETLAKFGPAARSAVPTLIAELSAPAFLRYSPPGKTVPGDPKTVHGDPGPNYSVISALADIGDTDPAVLLALRRLQSSEVGRVQIAALAGLSQLTPDSPDVLGDLLTWLRDHREQPGREFGSRTEVILAIGSLAVDRKDAVRPLIGELGSSEAAIRKAAAFALGQIGPAAQDALPELRKLLVDRENPATPRTSSWNEQFFDGPRTRIETSRHNFRIPQLPGADQVRRLIKLSVSRVVREAIAAIEQPASPAH